MSDTTNPTGSESLSLMDAAAVLDDPSPQNGQGEDVGTEVEDQIQSEAEALQDDEDDVDTEASDELDEADEDDSDEYEDDSDDDESEDEQVDEPEYLTVKVDGEEKQVTIDELKSGYSRTQDYTRKTQELANQRKEFEAEAQAIRAERQQYAQLLNELQNQLTTEKEPDWENLKQTDPIEYSIQVADWQRKQQMQQAAQAEQQRLAQLQQVEMQKHLAKQLEQAQQKIVEMIPEWSDKEKSKTVKSMIREQGKKIGFSDEELQQVYDPRAVVALHKAALYDQLMSKKAQLKPEKPATKTVKSGKRSTIGRTTDVKRAKQQLTSTGDIRSAVALLNLMEK